MMTNTKLISIASLLAICTACTDFLELEPKVNQLEGNAYLAEGDANEAVVAVYNALAVQPWIFVPMQSDIFSDDAFTGGEPGGGMPQYQEQESSIISVENAAAADLWNKLYSGIYRANFYFTKEGGIDWKSEDKRSRLAAEVRVLRAYFYWDLARHYGWVPLITESIEDLESAKDLNQVTPEEVYQYAVSELLKAIPDLPDMASGSEAGRVTADMAKVLLARIFMHYDGFVQPVLGAGATLTDGTTNVTKSYIQSMLVEIINSGRYRLLDNYSDVFDWGNENNDESIFEWQYSEKANSLDWGGWGIRGNFSSVFYGPRDPLGDPDITTGWSFGIVSWSLYDEFEDGDPRREATIYNAEASLTKYTKGFQNTGYFNYKYMPRAAYMPTTGQVEHNIPINYKDMRLAEVLLMAAELLVDDDNTKATEYLNEVRVRAMGEAAKLTGVTLDDIYHERRVELALEGHRKWDLLRRGLDYAKQRIDASWQVPGTATNGSDFQGRQFLTDTYGMLPIPGSEVRLTSSLRQYVPAFK